MPNEPSSVAFAAGRKQNTARKYDRQTFTYLPDGIADRISHRPSRLANLPVYVLRVIPFPKPLNLGSTRILAAIAVPMMLRVASRKLIGALQGYTVACIDSDKHLNRL